MVHNPTFLTLTVLVTVLFCFLPCSVTGRVLHPRLGTRCIEDCRLYGSEYKCKAITADGRSNILHCSPENSKSVDYKRQPWQLDDSGDVKYNHLNKRQVFSVKQDKGNCIETSFTAEPDPDAIADGSRWRGEIPKITARWSNGRLGNQARSQLVTTENLRIDLQGLVNRDQQRYYNLQIQVNVRRQSGESTTVSQVLVPRNPPEPIPDRYVRMAFVESFRRRAKVTVKVRVIPGCNSRRRNKKNN